MNKLIETLAALVLSCADTKITRLEKNTYKRSNLIMDIMTHTSSMTFIIMTG